MDSGSKISSDKKISVYCKFQFELIHCFDNVEDCGFDEVSYLKFAHRHLVKCKVEVPVHHNDRDVEFIMLKHNCESFIEQDKKTWPLRISMEMIAEKIYNHIINTYGSDYSPVFIEVSEDGENGAILRDKRW